MQRLGQFKRCLVCPNLKGWETDSGAEGCRSYRRTKSARTANSLEIGHGQTDPSPLPYVGLRCRTCAACSAGAAARGLTGDACKASVSVASSGMGVASGLPVCGAGGGPSDGWPRLPVSGRPCAVAAVAAVDAGCWPGTGAGAGRSDAGPRLPVWAVAAVGLPWS